MTSVPISQCGACQRLRGPLSEGAPEGLDGPWCEAFPAGVPEAVYNNTLDHREPIEGDHGLRWLARPGASYPVVYTRDVTAITAAGAPDSTRAGAMVALMPRADWAAGAAVDDGLAADELHVTLAHLGDDASVIPEATRGDILRAMADLASRMPPLEARAFAVSLFNPLGEQPCVVLGLGGAELALLRANAMADLDALESGALGLTSQYQPWAPHVTLAYTDDHFMPADLVDRTSAPVPLDRLRVAFGDQVMDFALGECPPGQHKMPDGGCMPDELMPEYAAGGEPWHGVGAVEGAWSGDERMLAPMSVQWDDSMFPIPLLWQPAEAPGHDGAVIVGRVDGARREGPLIRAWGVMDGEGAAGIEAARLMAALMLRGVSVSLDDTSDLDVEWVCPAPLVDLDATPPERMAMTECPVKPRAIIHSGRLRSLTLVAEPAFPECVVHLGPTHDAAPVLEALTASAVAPHDTPISEAADWDGAANEARLPSPMPVATGREVYAWIDDSMVDGDEMPKGAGRFPHHEVGEDGVPGAANVVACSAGIAALNGARGGTTVDDRAEVYEHLAGHLRDADREPPPLTASARALVAATHTITIPDLPPAAWFDEPGAGEMPPFGALHVGDDGRVVGLLAPAGVTHRAFRPRGLAVTSPTRVDASEFMNKPVLVAAADGSTRRLAAGNITMSCGHADANDPRRADPRFALEHYDNSCSVVARVRVGESAAGTWVAGALLSSVTAEQVERMMACALSGDWQDGRLNAALLVPVEGFPVTASARARDGAITASTTPVRLRPSPRAELEQLAQRIGRDAGSRMAALKARRDVAGGG